MIKKPKNEKVKLNTRIYIFVLLIISFTLFSLISKNNRLNTGLIVILFWGALQFSLESFYIKLKKGATSSLSFATLCAAIILFGPLTAGIIALFQGITFQELSNAKKRRLSKWLFNSLQNSTSTMISGLAYVSLGGLVFLKAQSGFTVVNFTSQILPLLAIISIFYVTNTFLVSLAIFFDKGISIKNVWLLNFSWGDLNYLALGFLGIILAQIYYFEPYALLLLIVPLVIARQALDRYMKLEHAYSSTIAALIKAIEAKDPYTKGHSERVAKFSAKIARQISLPENQIEDLERIASLHDIGKIGIAKKILLKNSKLTEKEFAKIKKHPIIGSRILKDVSFLKGLVPAVYYHHEKVDGSGYNVGLSGKNIPLFARIISIADSYDAMTSDRAYRKALPQKSVINQLVENSGSQFDATLVQALLQVLNVDPGLQHKTAAASPISQPEVIST